jgi:hypothetical protein
MLQLMSAKDRAVYLVANVTPQVRESFLSSLAADARPGEEAAMMKWMTPHNGGLQRAHYLETLPPQQRAVTEGWMLAHEEPEEREAYLQALDAKQRSMAEGPLLAHMARCDEYV